MARPTVKIIADLDVADNKRRLMAQVGTLKGLYRVSLEPARPSRSNRANSWYWACIVGSFVQYLNEQDYNITTPDEAHSLLKARFLARTIMDKDGKVIGRMVGSTTDLDTSGFHDYCERCRTWLADFFGIIVPDPGEAIQNEASVEA